jgi:DNA invertase Pin-like site-specific DNA recombinase
MRAAIYLRQSQDREGNSLGIDRQREECEKLVSARRWTIVEEFVDNDVSATSRKPRPEFNRMMKRVEAGQIDVIVSRHMDRLLRRLSELESVLERCAKTNTILVTAADSVDTSTDGGRLIARILSSVAQGEVERKSARQKSAVIQAAKQGRWVGGRRAFGYEPDGMTVREDEAALIRQGYRDILAGESLSEVARRWTAAGFPTPQGRADWMRNSVKDVLTNPRNCALRRHRVQEDRNQSRANPELGIVGPAQWPAIVDEQTWRATARLLCNPSRRRPPHNGRGLLTGIALCGVCGETVHRGGATHRGVQGYRCRSGRHVSRKSVPIDTYITEIVLARLSRPDAVRLWAARKDVADLVAEADVLRHRLADLAEDYLVMTREQFRVANDAVTVRLAEVESQIAAGSGDSSLAQVAAAVDKRQAWDELTMAQRRNIIDTLMVVKIHLVGAGVRTFKPESVEVIPR